MSKSRGAEDVDRAIEVTFTSGIAKQIDATTDWMDRNSGQVADGTVHLLFVSSLLIHAFWIETIGGDFVVAIDFPQTMASLKQEDFYSSDDFVRIVILAPRNNALSNPPTV